MNLVAAVLFSVFAFSHSGHALIPEPSPIPCNGTDALDDTACVQGWIDQASAVGGGELYVTSGTYLVNWVELRSNIQLRCASPHTAIFKKFDQQRQMFINKTLQQPQQRYELDNLTIENCGFDNAGADTNFDSIINIDNDPISVNDNIIVRNNVFFDSVNPGRMYGGEHQRQWIIAQACFNCYFLDNDLSDGGRIKTAGPGEFIQISGNVIKHTNDNAITISNREIDVTTKVIISDNIIYSPTNNCIFFGSDGSQWDDPNGATFDVVITDNICEGVFNDNCIKGILSAQTSRIVVSGNLCRATGPREDTTGFRSGIFLKKLRCDLAPATQVLVTDNIVTSPFEDQFNLAGIYVAGCYDNIRISGNSLESAGADSIRVRGWEDMGIVQIQDNVVIGGRLRIDVETGETYFKGMITGNYFEGDLDGIIILAVPTTTTNALVSSNKFETDSACITLSGDSQYDLTLPDTNDYGACIDQVRLLNGAQFP